MIIISVSQHAGVKKQNIKKHTCSLICSIPPGIIKDSLFRGISSQVKDNELQYKKKTIIDWHFPYDAPSYLIYYALPGMQYLDKL